jgi:CheY-like chemotaxis protein
MSQATLSCRSRRGMLAIALVCLTIGLAKTGAPALAQAAQQSVAAAGNSDGGMADMAGHMYMTVLRSPKAGDQQKADAIVAAAKSAMAPYQDYHKALADGFEIFLPDVPQSQYHFTKHQYGFEAAFHFDPLKPTSLLYKKTADSGYKLVGAMYTDRGRHGGGIKRPDSS